MRGFLSYIFLSLHLHASSSLIPFVQHPNLIVIRSKREKEREEEKKKKISSLHDDLVQIPLDLRERVHAAIFFFKI